MLSQWTRRVVLPVPAQSRVDRRASGPLIGERFTAGAAL